MIYITLVGIGGAFGAIARHLVNQMAMTHLNSSLMGTFIVNISGSFVLGILAGILSSYPNLPEGTRLFMAVGFLGSYTTFSTFNLATIQLLEKGDLFNAFINIISTIIIGLIAAMAGLVIGRTI